MARKEERTIKELQEIAKTNGFYLCPEKVWCEMGNSIMYLKSEIKRLKKRRDVLVKKIKYNPLYCKECGKRLK